MTPAQVLAQQHILTQASTLVGVALLIVVAVMCIPWKEHK